MSDDAGRSGRGGRAGSLVRRGVLFGTAGSATVAAVVLAALMVRHLLRVRRDGAVPPPRRDRLEPLP